MDLIPPQWKEFKSSLPKYGMSNFPSFTEWLAKQEESTAFTRRRDNAAQGLSPKIPDAEMHRHSTYPWADNVKKYGSKWGPKPKKKHAKKKKD